MAESPVIHLILLPLISSNFTTYISMHIRLQRENAFVIQTLIFCPWDIRSYYTRITCILHDLTSHVSRPWGDNVPPWSLTVFRPMQLLCFNFQIGILG